MSRKHGQDIDLGLAVISAISKPGQRWSHAAIAAACGVYKNAICEIERAALRKVRRRLKPCSIDLSEIRDLRSAIR